MKNIINIKGICACVALLFAMTSCDDFLNTPPSDKLSSEGFYQTASQAEQGLLGVYSALRSVSNDEFLYMSEVRSDNVWGDPKPNGLREYAEITTFRGGDDITTFNSIWNTWFKVIYNANVALAKVPNTDFGTNTAVKNQFLGELHFIRGWAYFEMVRLFGNIPLVEAPMAPGDVAKVPQSTAREILDKIVIPDLKFAKDNLPLMKDMVDANKATIASSGRADRIAAQAMLGRVYMAMAGFPHNDAAAKGLAETELKAVIDFSVANANKYWAPDSTEWRKQWMPTTAYYNKYSVFAIQYRTGGTGNQAIFNFSPAMPPTYTGMRIFGNAIFVEKSLMYEFDKKHNVAVKARRDARGYYYTLLDGYDAEPNNPVYSKSFDKYTPAGGTEVDVQTNAFYYKYIPTKRKLTALSLTFDEATLKDYDDWPVNYPVIRLEDVQLMYAEILVGKGDITGAMDIVNKIRLRAGCDAATAATAAQALDMVKRERRIELAGEGVRWFDLVRWNEWKTAIQSKFDRYNNPDGTDKTDVKDGRYLYPIPLSQMNVKPGLYTQNNGY